jgi:hypothetical protein
MCKLHKCFWMTMSPQWKILHVYSIICFTANYCFIKACIFH